MSDENLNGTRAGAGFDPSTAEDGLRDATPAAEHDGEPDGRHEESSDVAAQFGVGPFTIREVAIAGVWVLAFIVSFFSLSVLGFVSVWTHGIDWILAIGVPTAAVFLLVLRRLSPTGIRRVGSLGIDQFASVAFSVAAVVWLEQVWLQVSIAVSGGLWETTWVVWVELVLMLAGVVLTVFAPFIPVLEEDFQGRPAAAAHRNTRPVRAVVARPRTERPHPDRTASDPSTAGAPGAVASESGIHETAPAAYETTGEWTEPFAALDLEPQPERHEAFWALAPEERDVLDESGRPLFRIGPAAWALVIEDRGEVFVIRHEDGRVGYLHDVSGVTRG